ncbi:MAG: hypothetical protein AB7F39_06630 [Variibacter sp.]
MATVRGAIPDFMLANPIYAGARVSFYTVDPDTGLRTSTLATLYASATGTQTASNPQELDSEGKFSAPVYTEVPLIAEVTGVNVGSHTTGIIAVRGTWRGDWATSTVYFANDFIYDPVTGNLYAARDDFRSGATITIDFEADHLAEVINQVSLITGGAALAIKVPVAVATTGETLTHTGLPVIDGYQVVAGDRVLDKDNSDATARGIWNAAAGAWTRAVDLDRSAKFGDGLIVYVRKGDMNANRGWQLNISLPFTLGTSAIVWTPLELPDSSIGVSFNSAPDTYLTADVAVKYAHVPFACTIQSALVIGNTAGNIVLGIFKAAFPDVPDSGDSITAALPPSLTNAQANRMTTLTGWTVDLDKGDVLGFAISSTSGLRFARIELPVRRR